MRCPECGKITGDINRHMFKEHGIKCSISYPPKTTAYDRVDRDYIYENRTKYLRRIAR